jgi:hypothetical protein
MTSDHHPRSSGWYRSRTGLALLAFLAIGVFFLVTDHRAHALSALPYLFVLLCPLLHLFLHGRHGGGRADHGANPGQRPGGGEQ